MPGKTFSIPSDVESLFTALSGAAFKRAAERVPPELWCASSEDLEERLRPSESARALRAALAHELGDALFGATSVKLKRVAARGGLSYDHAHDLLTRDPAMLAWLIRPLRFSKNIEALASILLERIREIIDLPMTDATGGVIVRNAKLVIRAVEVLIPVRKT